MRLKKEVVIQNVHSEFVVTANLLPNTRVTQDIYERNRSGQGFKHNIWNLLLKVQVWPFTFWISNTGQVFSLFENADGSVLFKLDDRYCLTVIDGKLIIQEENEDKESLLNFYLRRKKYS